MSHSALTIALSSPPIGEEDGEGGEVGGVGIPEGVKGMAGAFTGGDAEKSFSGLASLFPWIGNFSPSALFKSSLL
jgi:hypothetical protein